MTDTSLIDFRCVPLASVLAIIAAAFLAPVSIIAVLIIIIAITLLSISIALLSISIALLSIVTRGVTTTFSTFSNLAFSRCLGRRVHAGGCYVATLLAIVAVIATLLAIVTVIASLLPVTIAIGEFFIGDSET